MTLIHSTADAVTLTLSTAALEKKCELLRSAALVEQVTTADEQETAVRLARDIRAALKSAEESRVEVKAPVLALGKRIDALAKDYTATLDMELARIGRHVSSFQEQEARRVAEEKRLRDLEVAEMENQRKLAELNALAQAAQMQDEAGLKRAIDAEQAAKDADEQARAVIVSPLPRAEKAAGTITKRLPVVTVKDIHALYAHDKTLCRLELNKAELLTRLYEGASYPGLQISWETASTFRA